MSKPETMHFDALPALGPLYVRAATRRRRTPCAETGLEALSAGVDRVHVNPEELQAYRRVCGIADTGTVPLPYLQVLAAPLHAAIIAHADFALPALGLVHLENTMVQHRALHPEEAIALSARVLEGRWDERLGYIVTLGSEARVGQELVWESELTALSPVRRGKKRATKKGEAPPSGEAPGTRVSVMVDVPEAQGRRYAGVSGDYNPIHLHALTARAFGFPRAIAHGMWTLSRVWAEAQPLLQTEGELRLQARFRKPVMLPSRIWIGVREAADGEGLELCCKSPDLSKTHLEGSVTRG
ncbi:MaoC family dehydratase [Lujinxingia litoralis]|nr:MaoC/PaaZ C-terminal domain-containing protein [Lujinxingia litoralis]